MSSNRPRDPAETRAFIELEGVSMRYGGREGTLALEGFDLRVAKGEVLVVVGPSGCGKSSLLRLVSGLSAPSEGSVCVAGELVREPISRIGIAFQNPTLLPWRSTIRNVLLPLEVAPAHRKTFRARRPAHEQSANALLATVGLSGFEERYPWELSGGMQQRASLCRALIHEPEILLLDEPFGALDAFTREELWLSLEALWLERRFTLILVTHDLREAVFLADRVLVLSNRPGRVVAEERVALPRPRKLEETFEPAFAMLVRGLRDRIATLMKEAR